MNLDVKYWEDKFTEYFKGRNFKDSSHNLSHFKRVWNIANEIKSDVDDSLVILAACYFHDLVSYPKNHPNRSLSSTHAAEQTVKILAKMNFPEEKLENVKHSIMAHSFSANIIPETNEAKVVQDADRMEALGAIGLARTFYISGMLGSELFCEEDPFAVDRDLDDKKFAIDHFYIKLLKLPESMQTSSGKAFAKKRNDILIKYLEDLKEELGFTS